MRDFLIVTSLIGFLFLIFANFVGADTEESRKPPMRPTITVTPTNNPTNRFDYNQPSMHYTTNGICETIR
jgi:hypothetical protein